MTDIIGTRDNDSLTATGSGGLVVGRSATTPFSQRGCRHHLCDNNASAATGGSPNYGYEIIQDRTATVTFQVKALAFAMRWACTGLMPMAASSVEVLFANASLKNSGGDLIAGQSKSRSICVLVRPSASSSCRTAFRRARPRCSARTEPSLSSIPTASLVIWAAARTSHCGCSF